MIFKTSFTVGFLPDGSPELIHMQSRIHCRARKPVWQIFRRERLPKTTLLEARRPTARAAKSQSRQEKGIRLIRLLFVR
jgi:hypothetical protein